MNNGLCDFTRDLGVKLLLDAWASEWEGMGPIVSRCQWQCKRLVARM